MTSELAQSVLDGDRKALAKAITLVESTRNDHNVEAERLIEELLPSTGGALRIGVTGSPGVGKSTFIDAFGSIVVADGHRVAVLAVDPSSTSAGGSILGDKTRMATLVTSENVFIRPSPSGGSLGGIGRRTRDAILLCEAAGFDIVLVETVGVGQSETTVATVTDLFLLLVSPGGGDDLQGIKRGVMELADLVVVTKADGAMAELAVQTAADYQLALHLLRPKSPDNETSVLTCSSTIGSGLEQVWTTLVELHRAMSESGRLAALRRSQAISQLEDEVRGSLFARAAADSRFAKQRAELERSVADGELPVSAAARQLIELLPWTEPNQPDEPNRPG
ncbi:MAG: methylmalonyl Co-A mutase-associated GTPase MeaB [Acidimicrobiales bacterium]